MNRKLPALLLALCLCVSLLTGCKKEDAAEPTPTPDGAAVTLDSAGAWGKHQPDDVVFTVDGSAVTWAEFFYYVNMISGNVVSSYNNYGMPFSWDEVLGETTVEDSIRREAVDVCVQYHVMDAHLQALGVKLTAEDEQALADRVAEESALYAGEGASEADFEKALAEMYLTREIYDYINRVSMLYDRAYTEKFGRQGEQLSDEEIASFVEENAYITAKHILIKTVDAANQPLEGQDLAEKTARATLLYSQLQEVQGDREALLAKFDELMTEYTEDPGTQAYPNGYTFKPGEMVDEFQTGAEALEDYAFSEPVQSQIGYHIILRLPTTRDSVVDYIDGTNDNTVGAYAAADVFGKLLKTWVDEARVEWSKDFEDLSLGALYG